jgi:hypothetical protein
MSQVVLGFITTLVILAITASAYNLGKESVEFIDKDCPQQEDTLMYSVHSSKNTICVYQRIKPASKLKKVIL